MSGLLAHLQSGATTVARLWRLERRDGPVFGFTDHDRDLTVSGEVYQAASGLTGRALSRSTGLSVDNSEVLGALQSGALREEDLRAGRWDGAEVVVSLVNWADPSQMHVLFRGSLGEISRSEGAFRAELRGITEGLSDAQERVYQRNCTAVLGDTRCGVDLRGAGLRWTPEAEEIREGRIFRFPATPGYADRWFERGVLRVTSGAAQGLAGMIRNDRLSGAWREVELWDRLALDVQPGDGLELTAGCDRQPGTCREKFGNFLNYRGFPHLPSEDWLMASPAAAR